MRRVNLQLCNLRSMLSIEIIQERDKFIDYRREERKSWRKTRWHMLIWKAIIKVERIASKIIAILWSRSFPNQSLLEPILQLVINLSENARWRETSKSLNATKCNWRCNSCFPMKLDELILLWDLHSACLCCVICDNMW